MPSSQNDASPRRQQRAVECLGGLAANLIDCDRTIDVLLQQLVGADEVELVVLLNTVVPCVGHRFERDGRRVDQRGHIGKIAPRCGPSSDQIALLPDDGVAGTAPRAGARDRHRARSSRALRCCRSSVPWLAQLTAGDVSAGGRNRGQAAATAALIEAEAVADTGAPGVGHDPG